MAQTQDTQTRKHPSFIAWSVTEKGDQSIWQKVGASWSHKDGKGMTLQLDAVPLDGRLVLRRPIERSKPEAA